MNVTIRASNRAKKMFIQVTPIGQVELVVPAGKSTQRAIAFANSQLDWIQKTVDSICNQRKLVHGIQGDLPDKILFRSVNLQWNIEFKPCEKRGSKLSLTCNDKLIVSAQNPHQSILTLNDWVRKQAKVILSPWLQEISNAIEIPFNRVIIRNQKTRWGSCSAKNNINLNQKLLFLPSHLVRYVLIHELCHVKFLNHSRKYWSLVRIFDSDYIRHETELKNANIYVPSWTYKKP